jgi:hypothetical protein
VQRFERLPHRLIKLNLLGMTNSIKKGLMIAGVFSAQAPDKTAEVIDVKGMDISSLNDGTAILNAEHEGGKFSSYLGRIVSAKKIFKEEDCKTAHEKKSFKECGENPIIYGVAELFDDEDHSEAKDAAAVIKHYKKRGLPIAARFSIEGSSLDKDGNLIKRSIARRVALTIAPCNAACESEVVSELSKSEKDTYATITKRYNESKGVTTDLMVVDQDSILKSLNSLQDVFGKLQKALEAGVASGAPGTLTQGASLQGKAKKKEETSPSKGEETTDVGEETTNKLKPVDEDKLEVIDDRAKEMSVKEIKLKKAEIFIYKNLKILQQG